MKELDRIQGEKRFEIFNNLKKERTFIKMQIPSVEYEQLTIITDVRTQGGTPFLIIDPPKSFNDAVSDLDGVNINFEFSEKDGARFTFKSSGGKIHNQEIWVAFPDYIERIQRRKDFRLEFPARTMAHFEIDSVGYEMTFKNLSIGGAYVEISMVRNENKEIPIFKPGDMLIDIDLTVPLEEEKLKTHINKASIIRVSEMEKQSGFSLGLQFIEIEKNELNILKKIIYDLQRILLQRRLEADA